MLFESVWDSWEAIEAHRDSTLSEDKVLTEFGTHIHREDLTVRLYEEVE